MECFHIGLPCELGVYWFETEWLYIIHEYSGPLSLQKVNNNGQAVLKFKQPFISIQLVYTSSQQE